MPIDHAHMTASSTSTALRLTQATFVPTDDEPMSTRKRTRRPAAAASVAATHGYAIDGSDPAEIALAAGHTRRMINRIVALPKPCIEDVFEAMVGFQPHLMAHVILEFAAIIECASLHDPDWWDEDHMFGTHTELLVDWALPPEDAEYTVLLLSVLNRYTIDALFLAPGAPIELNPGSLTDLPDLGDLVDFLIVAVTVIRHAGQRRTWYAECRRCRTF